MMKLVAALLPLLAASSYALSVQNIQRQEKFSCDAPVYLNASTNIWKNYTLHPNIFYRTKVLEAAENASTHELKEQALGLSKFGTFVWIRGRKDIGKIEEAVKDVPCNNILGLVLDGLPFKSCPSTGKVPDKDPFSYPKEYIDPIVKVIREHPNTAFALIIEPHVVYDVVVNGGVDSCQHLRETYRSNVPYALKSLSLSNVILYLDACHGGCFGWRDLQKPGAEELISTWRNAGEPAQFRGLAVNVEGYNSLDSSPGELFLGESTCYDIENPARNEMRYMKILNRTIGKTSMPMHGIVDTSRSGQIGIRGNWSNWCNIKDAAFGIPPVNNTKNVFLDATVWAKNGGESDGTSDPASPNYDSFCGNDVVAYKPMPEKGEWSQQYFEMLLRFWKNREPYADPWKRMDSDAWAREDVSASCG